MRRLRCVVARTPAEIADAQRVRWVVYGEQERLLPPEVAREGREIASRDLEADTVHLIAYDGDEPVGTVRLLPAREGSRFDLESTFHLAVSPSHAFVGAEVTRYCVVRRLRCTPVARMLHLALAIETRRRGITHWLAAANLETDSADEAAMVFQVVRARNLVDPCFQATPRHAPAAAGRRHCYTVDEMRQAAAWGPAGLHLPRALALFTAKMGARCMGPPAYDPYFNVFALPIVAEVPAAPAARGGRAPGPLRNPPASPATPAHP